MKGLMLWENDFKNKRDWISLCKALDLPEDTVEIEMECNVGRVFINHIILKMKG